MKKLANYYLFILTFFVATSFTSDFQGISDDISAAIKSGNATELSKLFNATIDVTLPGNSNSYSKSQAEIIVKDFFKKFPPKNFNIIHQGVSADGSQYSIGKYESASQSFRTYFLLKKFGEKSLIQQLRFEAEE